MTLLLLALNRQRQCRRGRQGRLDISQVFFERRRVTLILHEEKKKK
jgi:hypothetical protein